MAVLMSNLPYFFVPLINELLAFVFVKMNQDFGIALGTKPVAARFERSTQYLVIVNLTIEDNLDGPVFIANRLIAPRRASR